MNSPAPLTNISNAMTIIACGKLLSREPLHQCWSRRNINRMRLNTADLNGRLRYALRTHLQPRRQAESLNSLIDRAPIYSQRISHFLHCSISLQSMGNNVFSHFRSSTHNANEYNAQSEISQVACQADF